MRKEKSSSRSVPNKGLVGSSNSTKKQLVTGTFSNKKSGSRSRASKMTSSRRGRSRERSMAAPTTTTTTATTTSTPAAGKKNNKVVLVFDDDYGEERRDDVNNYHNEIEEQQLDLIRSFHEQVAEHQRKLDIIRSMSQGEARDNNIFDLHENFSGDAGESPFSTFSPATSQDDDSRDDYEETEEEDSFGERIFHSWNDEGDSDSVSDDDDDEESIEGSSTMDNYLDRIIDKLHIKNVLGGLQDIGVGNSNDRDLDDTASGSDDDDDEDAIEAYEAEAEDLEMRLRKEVKRNKKLEQKLAEISKRHISQSTRQQNKIISLESKLALQQRTFATQLQAEKQKRMRAAKESRNDQDAECEERLDCSAERKGDGTKAERAYLSKNQSAISDQLQVDLIKMKEMLELEKKRCRELQMSEARAQMLLSAERERVEAMDNVNQQLEAAMRRLGSKAGRGRNAGDDSEQLRKQLKKKDNQISVIRTILKNNPGKIHPRLLDSMVPESPLNDISLNDFPMPELD